MASRFGRCHAADFLNIRHAGSMIGVVNTRKTIPMPDPIKPTAADWIAIAKAAGEHGIRYRTNSALIAFLKQIAPHCGDAQQARDQALEDAAKVALDPGFIQARDSEWDTGFNDAKRVIAHAIRALKEQRPC